MFGGNNPNHLHPVFQDGTRFQYQSNGSNPLQLIGNLSAGCNVNPVNFVGNEHTTLMHRPNKRGREMEENSRKQKLQFSLNYNMCKDEVDHTTSIPNQTHVSTGLRLSCDDDERNSSITSASGSLASAPSIILSLGDSIRTELNRQKEEFDEYVKIQEENLVKGVRDMKQRHMASFLASMEKGITKKLHEKDQEIASINHKNKELIDKLKQVAMEAQNWHYRAKYNESVVNLLKSNLQQAMAQCPDQQGKEGFGDSEVDDAVSYVGPNNYVNVARDVQNPKERMACRACKVREVSVLLTPCRHLCLCKECDVHVNVCPVCQLMKTASYEVFLS